MPDTIYHHREQSRRPLTAFAALVGAGMLWFGWLNAAPWFFFLPVGFAFLAGIWMLVFNTVAEITIDRSSISLSLGAHRKVIAVSDVISYSSTTWSDGPDHFTLQLANEADYAIPSRCVGNSKKLRAALEQLGLKQRC